VEFQRIDDEGVLLDMEVGRYFRLNSSAADVWQMLESPSDTDALAARLGDLYAVDPPAISADIRGVVDEMVRLGVVVQADEDGTAPVGRDRA
jgi:hypothetical protein